jgi:nicotinate-nucleotide adenylyltransferase
MGTPTGILGGVFDPIHNGHLAIASLARDFFNLSSVYFIPSGTPPHKNAVVASAHHRLAMLQLSLKGVSWASIWEQEIHCGDGYSYTIDTIELMLKTIDGPLYFIIGTDNLREIQTWYRYRDLLSKITLCVAHRPGYPAEIPAELKGAQIIHFPSPEWGLSSSIVRSYHSKGLTCRYLMPDSVIEYIQKHALYVPSGTAKT